MKAQVEGSAPDFSGTDTEGTPSGLRIARIATAAVLGLTLLAVWLFTDLVHPAPAYTTKYDPEILYFMNSLAVFKSQPYLYVHHPGTPVEVIGTILFGLLKVLRGESSDSFWVAQLQRPETFLTLAHAAVTLASMITICLLVLRGNRIRSRWDLLLAAGVAVSFFALHPPYSFDSLSFWSHNSFTFGAGTLLLLWLKTVLDPGRPVPVWQQVFLGVLAGALTAVQLYFGAWVVGVAAALSVHSAVVRGKLRWSLHSLALVAAGATAGFFLATQSILHQYREFVWWTKGLIEHQGIFGRGPSGITSASRLADNLRRLWAEGGAVVMLALVLGLALLAWAAVRERPRWSDQRGRWSLAAGLAVQLIITMTLIAKHPGEIYLLGIASAWPLVWLVGAQVLGSAGRLGRASVAVVSMILVAGFLRSLSISVSDHVDRVSGVEARQAEMETFLRTYAESRGRTADSVIMVAGFGVPSLCFALRFGDSYAGNAFHAEIEGLCPREGIYDVWSDMIDVGGERAPLAEHQGWEVLVIPARFAPAEGPGITRIAGPPGAQFEYFVRGDPP